MLIDIHNKKYKTRSGRKPRFLCDDNEGEYPIVGTVEGMALSWTLDGRIHAAPGFKSEYDLIEELQ
jgi:hypothetical protein